jgi:hypothetical protein
MKIIKETDKAIFFLDENCDKLDDNYCIICGLMKSNFFQEYLLMKKGESKPIYSNQFILPVLIKYKTIIKLYEQEIRQEQNNQTCSNN